MMVRHYLVPGFNIEDLPNEVRRSIEHLLDKNGGNCLDVDQESVFGKYLISQDIPFDRNWIWVVVWR